MVLIGFNFGINKGGSGGASWQDFLAVIFLFDSMLRLVVHQFSCHNFFIVLLAE